MSYYIGQRGRANRRRRRRLSRCMAVHDKTAHNNDVWRTRSDRRTSRRVINQAGGRTRGGHWWRASIPLSAPHPVFLPPHALTLPASAAAAVAGDASIFGGGGGACVRACVRGSVALTSRSAVTSGVERDGPCSLVARTGAARTGVA